MDKDFWIMGFFMTMSLLIGIGLGYTLNDSFHPEDEELLKLKTEIINRLDQKDSLNVLFIKNVNSITGEKTYVTAFGYSFKDGNMQGNFWNWVRLKK